MTTGATAETTGKMECHDVCLEVSDPFRSDSNLSRDRGGHCSS